MSFFYSPRLPIRPHSARGKENSLSNSWNLMTSSLLTTLSFLCTNWTCFLYLRGFPPDPSFQFAWPNIDICTPLTDVSHHEVQRQGEHGLRGCSQPSSELPTLERLEWSSWFSSLGHLLTITWLSHFKAQRTVCKPLPSQYGWNSSTQWGDLWTRAARMAAKKGAQQMAGISTI